MHKRINQVRRLLAQHEIDAMLVTSIYNRRYMTGFTGTAGVALITEQEAVFITDFRYMEQAAEQATGYEVVQHTAQIEKTIAEQLKRLKVNRLGFEEDHVSFAKHRTYMEQFRDTTLVPVRGMIEELRMVKDQSELETIKQAVNIIDRTYEYILTFIKPGMKEWEVANELEFQMRKLGASSSSFDMIVASGTRSAMPHGVASEKVIEKGDWVTLDFGAFYKGYASDMTRTFSLGEPDRQLREMYEVCLHAQIRGVERIKAGMTGKEADAICRDYITEQKYGDDFGHSTGHGLGLEVHEGPTLSKKSDVVLEPGMVVTVEPGIYIAGLGGVRIEDDIVITETGNEILTQSTKELLIIE